ncbi:MAG: L-threonylcarbamoyladenylate synthase [Candidatus Azotimanducaceae bacterium]|jgi:L-threonylcarbamoyladenylate synthase
MNEPKDSLERCLRRGGVIAYPTEAVWGLGCLPGSEQGVRKILELKGRSWEKGLILVAANINQVRPYINDSYLTLLSENKWAEPLDSSAVTYLVPKSESVPMWLSGKSEKIAVRISSHPFVKKLCEKLGSALVSTSANTANNPAAMNRAEVERYFPSGLDQICFGELGSQLSVSRIVDLESGKIIRGETA